MFRQKEKVVALSTRPITSHVSGQFPTDAIIPYFSGFSSVFSLKWILYISVELCTVVHSCPELCTVVHSCTEFCTVVHNCISLYRSVQLCRGLYSCRAVHRCTELCTAPWLSLMMMRVIMFSSLQVWPPQFPVQMTLAL